MFKKNLNSLKNLQKVIKIKLENHHFLPLTFKPNYLMKYKTQQNKS